MAGVRTKYDGTEIAPMGAGGQWRTPMRNFLVPHSVQTERVAGRPFFIVTASMSRHAVPSIVRTVATVLDVKH